MLRLEGVVKVFASDGGREVRALDGLSLDVREGELQAWMGPNGAGKSTALRIVNRELVPDDGKMSWDPPDGDSPNRGHRRVAHVPQEPRALSFPDMTLEEHLLWLELAGHSARFWARGITRARRHRYRALLQEYGAKELTDSLSSPLKTLSVGWQQVFTILAVALGPMLSSGRRHDLLLLDEPTSALDVENTRRCLDLIRRLHQQGQAIILATHHPEVALELAQRLIIIREGRAVSDISREEALQVGVEGLRRLVSDSYSPVPGGRHTELKAANP